ncbi:ATP/GTP-binding protein [Cyanothece sp. BG0011]|uniref:AAA family ATPase n=1 Tax=Cyanothece sp. BG0011 TaxID=2082950 RepID=UPI0018E55556|nr:AAA family ATPase [Cyanothece sp. BG0011]
MRHKNIKNNKRRQKDMIRDIEIENFRCFEHTKVEGFERVNLIGGKNNSGKTALLEAILLNQSPQPKTIFLLRQLRQESEEFSKAYPEKAWDNFFYNNQTELEGKIKTEYLENKYQEINLRTEKIDNFSDKTKLKRDSLYQSVDSFQSEEYFLLEKYYSSSSLNIGMIFDLNDSQDHKYGFKIVYNSKGFNINFLQDKSGFRRFSYLEKRLTEFEILLVSSHHFNKNLSNISEYSKLELNNKTDKLIKILQSIDDSIECIKVLSIGEPNLYIQQKSKNLLPSSLFGDAINRVTEIVLTIINNNLKTILIDEIENGIHYTNHRDFWRALFELSKELDVQIFATTHSLEMIQAFRDVGLEKYSDSGAYFEMARNPRTNKIIGIKHELEMLDYALKRSEGIRGE